MKKIIIVGIATLLVSLSVLVLWSTLAEVKAQESEGADTEPYEKQPATEGEVGPLSLGEYDTLDNYQMPCVTSQGYSPWDGSWVMKIIVGNAWGKVVDDGTRTSWADVYYDDGSGDCDYGDYAGQVDNDYPLEMYMSPVIGMDSGSYGAYFKFRLRVWEYSNTDCTGSYSSVGDVTSYADTDAWGDGATMWVELDFDSIGSDHVDSVPRVRSSTGRTGYKSYYYQIITTTCWDSSCSSYVSDSELGCFYVYWF